MNEPAWAVEPKLTQSWVNCTCVCRKECLHKGDLMAENESNVVLVKASGLLVLQAMPEVLSPGVEPDACRRSRKVPVWCSPWSPLICDLHA